MNRLIRTCQLAGNSPVFFILSDALMLSKYWALNFFLKRKNETLSPPTARRRGSHQLTYAGSRLLQTEF